MQLEVGASRNCHYDRPSDLHPIFFISPLLLIRPFIFTSTRLHKSKEHKRLLHEPLMMRSRQPDPPTPSRGTWRRGKPGLWAVDFWRQATSQARVVSSRLASRHADCRWRSITSATLMTPHIIITSSPNNLPLLISPASQLRNRKRRQPDISLLRWITRIMLLLHLYYRHMLCLIY